MFFGTGDKCVVTYDDGGTKEFTFSKVRGVSYAEFTAGDGEVIMPGQSSTSPVL